MMSCGGCAFARGYLCICLTKVPAASPHDPLAGTHAPTHRYREWLAYVDLFTRGVVKASIL